MYFLSGVSVVLCEPYKTKTNHQKHRHPQPLRAVESELEKMNDLLGFSESSLRVGMFSPWLI